MTWTAHSCFVTLAILFLWRAEEIAEACSCSPVHPQEGFCRSDVVIRAKVVGMQEIEVGNNIYGSPITRIQYDISQIKMFKGPEPKIDAIYSAPFSSLCGITLETGKEYLITGRLEADGKVHVTLCNFFRPWEDMSTTQKKSLTQLYEMGCDCKIIYCPSAPCMISNPTECLWLDWIMEKTVNGEQSKHFACVKRSDDSCAWYRGSAPPSKDFMDIEDP